MTDDLQASWAAISARMVTEEAGVAAGRMMSAEALTLNGKVFTFFSTKGGRPGLGLRLGRDYPLADLALTDWQHLSPFKTKPPMKDWIVAGRGDRSKWATLAEVALAVARARR